MNREYEFLEDGELDNCEDIFDFAEEHQMKKFIRSKSIARQKNICSKRYKKIVNRYKPSICVGIYWNLGGTELTYKPYISYGKNSRLQQCLKRATNKKLRQIKHCNLPVKGNYYRKIFDYWWTWLQKTIYAAWSENRT